MDYLIIKIFFSVVSVAGWVYSMVKPESLEEWTKPKGALSKKSAWIRTKTTRFLQKFFWWSFLPLILFVLWGPMEVGVYTYFILTGFYAGAGKLYSQRLKRQWLLWQQMGYDGPPELEAQQEKLQQTNTLTQ